MTGSEKRRLAEIAAPYGRRVRLDEVGYESGMTLLRVTIQEGARYTILELDAATATLWADEMAHWAQAQPREAG
jgi:hypothetical protein